MIRYINASVLLFSLVLLFMGCGEESNLLGPEQLAAYFPNTEGNSWTYDVKPYDSRSYWMTETISGSRSISGQDCQVLESTFNNNPGYKRRVFFHDDDAHCFDIYGHEQELGGTVFGHKEFDGYTLIFFPMDVGSMSSSIGHGGIYIMDAPEIGYYFDSNDLDNDGIDDAVDVVIETTVPLQEDITVPAGEFKGCFCVEQKITINMHLSSQGEKESTGLRRLWFAPYEGFVKRWINIINLPHPLYHLENTEELVSYTLN